MKKHLIYGLLALFTLGLVACSKDGKGDKLPFTYSVNNVQDRIIETSGTTALSVETVLLTGTVEQVTLSVKGMPANVTATPSNTTGTPNFITEFVFKATNAAPGTYPMTLESSSPSTGTKTLNFNLKIEEPADCSSELIATYSGAEDCTIGDDMYSIGVTGTGTPNKVIIENLYNAGFNAYAIVDCDSKSFVIPSQTIEDSGGVSVSGSGSYTATNITITYTILSGGVTVNTCTINFNR